MDVVIVLYRPRLHELRGIVDALCDAQSGGLRITLRVWHNDAGPETTPGLGQLYIDAQTRGLAVVLGGQGRNLGFGPAINAVMSEVDAPFVLLLNQDAIPEPVALEHMHALARSDDPVVAAWEFRQIPYEHPKDYDPVTLDTVWCSGAAVVLRTQALRQVNGFEPRFFMYCEDVDLSWRLRCKGWRIRYVPWCAVVHRTYSEPGEIKPLAVTQGCFANLCIRARFASRRVVIQGIRQLLRELAGSQTFTRRRAGLLKALAKFMWNYRYFRRTRCSHPDFEPCIAGWDYEMRRNGVFHPFRDACEWGHERTIVGILIDRTVDTLPLHERLSNLRHQTHRPLWVTVVGASESTNAHLQGLDPRDFPVTYVKDTAQALDVLSAQGVRWLMNAPTDSQRWYGDHVEVLLQTVLEQGRRSASAQLWQLHCSEARAHDGHRLHAARDTLASTHPRALHCALTDIHLVDRHSGLPVWAEMLAAGEVALLDRVTQVRYQSTA